MLSIRVVLYLTSTSNHNTRADSTFVQLLCYILLLHQTTTQGRVLPPRPCVVLYLTSTSNHNSEVLPVTPVSVVLYLTSTSNHNRGLIVSNVVSVVLYLTSTSNHNLCRTYALTLGLCYILLLHQTTTSVFRLRRYE